MDVVIAQFESHSFSFAACGRTEDEARAAFNRGADDHRRKLGAWVDPARVAEVEIGSKTVSLGVRYRDRWPLAGAGSPRARVCPLISRRRRRRGGA